MDDKFARTTGGKSVMVAKILGAETLRTKPTSIVVGEARTLDQVEQDRQHTKCPALNQLVRFCRDAAQCEFGVTIWDVRLVVSAADEITDIDVLVDKLPHRVSPTEEVGKALPNVVREIGLPKDRTSMWSAGIDAGEFRLRIIAGPEMTLDKSAPDIAHAEIVSDEEITAVTTTQVPQIAERFREEFADRNAAIVAARREWSKPSGDMLVHIRLLAKTKPDFAAYAAG